MVTVPALFDDVPRAVDPVSQRLPGRDALGQQDFLTLLTAQLQNQDPFAPMENGEFLGQMAQFSTVAGIEALNDSIKALDRGADRLTTGASLIGRSVLVEGRVARPDAKGEIHAALTLEAAARQVHVRYSDAATGRILAERNYGAQPPGSVPIAYTDLPAEIAADRGTVRIEAEADTDLGVVRLVPSVYARITGVDMPPGTDQTTLRVEDYGVLNSLEVTSLR